MLSFNVDFVFEYAVIHVTCEVSHFDDVVSVAQELVETSGLIVSWSRVKDTIIEELSSEGDI
jgi:hypothetical protein